MAPLDSRSTRKGSGYEKQIDLSIFACSCLFLFPQKGAYQLGIEPVFTTLKVYNFVLNLAVSLSMKAMAVFFTFCKTEKAPHK